MTQSTVGLIILIVSFGSIGCKERGDIKIPSGGQTNPGYMDRNPLQVPPTPADFSVDESRDSDSA